MQWCIGSEGCAGEETSVEGLQDGSWRDISLHLSLLCLHSHLLVLLLLQMDIEWTQLPQHEQVASGWREVEDVRRL